MDLDKPGQLILSKTTAALTGSFERNTFYKAQQWLHGALWNTYTYQHQPIVISFSFSAIYRKKREFLFRSINHGQLTLIHGLSVINQFKTKPYFFRPIWLSVDLVVCVNSSKITSALPQHLSSIYIMPASIMKLTCPTCSQSKSEPEPAATQLKLLLPNP